MSDSNETLPQFDNFDLSKYPTYTIEPHGSAHVLYEGRTPISHGLNLLTLSDGDMNFEKTCKLITKALNHLDKEQEKIKTLAQSVLDHINSKIDGDRIPEPSLNKIGVLAFDILKGFKEG